MSSCRPGAEVPSRSLVARADRRLLKMVDAAFADGSARAGEACACRVGCTACCIGPFPITALDARRLREGLRQLQRSDPSRAEALLARARVSGDRMRADRPAQGDDTAEEAFSLRYASMPCPALDPETGSCDLYVHRPLTCRTYGPPIHVAGEDLPPCELWLAGASADAVAACRVCPDPDDFEGAILASLGRPALETYVVFALCEVEDAEDDSGPTMEAN